MGVYIYISSLMKFSHLGYSVPPMTHRLSHKYLNTRQEKAPFELFVSVVQDNNKRLQTIAITLGLPNR